MKNIEREPRERLEKEQRKITNREMKEIKE